MKLSGCFPDALELSHENNLTYAPFVRDKSKPQ